MDPRSHALTPGPHPKEEDYEKLLRPRTLDEFIGQQKIKDNLRVFMTAALQRGETLDHVLLSGPAGLGKCITADSLILTGNGWLCFRDLIPKDIAPGSSRPLDLTVYGIAGPERTSHLYASGRVPTRRVTTRAGFTLEGTPHHPVLVATPAGPRWKSLGALQESDYVALACNLDLWGTPRRLFWHADAPSDRRAYSDRVVRHLHGRLARTSGRPPAGVDLRAAHNVAPGTTASSVAQQKGKPGLERGLTPGGAADKTVPGAIPTGTREAVIGFLQGLFDADGHARMDGYCEWTTCSEQLSREVQLLLAQLGIIACRSPQTVQGRPCWRLFIGGGEAVRFYDVVGFRLPSKQARRKLLTPRERAWSRSDLVPGATALLAALLDKTKPHPRAVQERFEHVKRGDRMLSRQRIRRCLDLLPERVADEPEYAALMALLHPTIRWDRVACVQESEAEAFDFVVPGTHSFVANGFFNHNTTLAGIIAEEMGAGITTSSGPVLDKPASIAGILTNLNEGDVLFIDEIHRLSPVVEEYLYSAMEDYKIDIVIDSGPNARSVQLTLPPFTLVGATTRKGLLTAPLRARFGIDFRYDYYTADLLQRIIERSARILGVDIDDEGAFEIARRSRGTPRIANRLLRRARDFAEVEGDGRISRALADHALNALDVDGEGLDDMDARILLTLIEKFGGGPTGLSNLAVSVGEDAGTIEEVYEPYLIQEGFLERTARGRVATPRAYAHFSLEPPSRTGKLFGG